MPPQLLRGQELCDRHVEPDGGDVGRRDEHAHLARRPAPADAGAIEVPRAVHPHVRMKDQIAGERHQQMFPA